MAAVMPMRYGSGACAVAGATAASASRAAALLRTRPRMSALLLVGSPRTAGPQPRDVLRLALPCEGGHLGGDAPLLVRREHRLDQLAVALQHQAALHLARGRDGLALLLGIQLARQHAERLHLLHAGERRVRPRDL